MEQRGSAATGGETRRPSGRGLWGAESGPPQCGTYHGCVLMDTPPRIVPTMPVGALAGSVGRHLNLAAIGRRISPAGTGTGRDWRVTMDDETYHGESVDRYVKRRAAFLARKYSMSDGEAEALAWNHLGYSASGIADMMGTTESTAKSHLRSIEDRYGLAPLEYAPPIPEPEAEMPTGNLRHPENSWSG